MNGPLSQLGLLLLTSCGHPALDLEEEFGERLGPDLLLRADLDRRSH
ncbi:MAG: hypothetical protein LC754_13845 [Acidobacteria bacterium]|nr:hypothetical protein [Acidobacteriota bacterium]